MPDTEIIQCDHTGCTDDEMERSYIWCLLFFFQDSGHHLINTELQLQHQGARGPPVGLQARQRQLHGLVIVILLKMYDERPIVVLGGF